MGNLKEKEVEEKKSVIPEKRRENFWMVYFFISVILVFLFLLFLVYVLPLVNQNEETPPEDQENVQVVNAHGHKKC